MKYNLLFFLFICCNNLFGQTVKIVPLDEYMVNSRNCCVCNDEDVFSEAAMEGKDSLKIFIYNYSKDTIFVFSSYFAEDISSSKWLYRVDDRAMNISLSFIPIFPLLGFTKSDLVRDTPLNNGQVTYDFDTIPPSNRYSRRVKIHNTQKNTEYLKTFICSNCYELPKNFKRRMKYKRIKDIKPYSFNVLIAYYYNIESFTSQDYFYNPFYFNQCAINNLKTIKSILIR